MFATKEENRHFSHWSNWEPFLKTLAILVIQMGIFHELTMLYNLNFPGSGNPGSAKLGQKNIEPGFQSE